MISDSSEVSPQPSGHHVDRFVHLGVAATAVMALLSSSSVAPSIVGNILLLTLISTLVVGSIVFGNFELQLPKRQLGLISVVIIMIFFNALREPLGQSLANSQALRAPIVVFSSCALLFYLPQVVRIRRTMSSIGVIVAIVIVLGIPSMVVGPYTVGWVEFAPYTTFHPLFLSAEIPQLTSFYGDVNALSKMSLVGFFASLFVLVERSESSLYRWTLGICLFGVYFTYSRGVLVALVVGLFVAATYWSEFVRDARLVTLSMILGSFLGFAVLFDLVPVIGTVVDIPLSSRGIAWRAAIEGVSDQPLLGHGLQDPTDITFPYLDPSIRPLTPQNTFLYMFMVSGVAGGAAYFLLIATSLLYVPDYDDPEDAVIVGLCCAWFVLMYFEMVPFFGLNQSSVFVSLSFGFLLTRRR